MALPLRLGCARVSPLPLDLGGRSELHEESPTRVLANSEAWHSPPKRACQRHTVSGQCSVSPTKPTSLLITLLAVAFLQGLVLHAITPCYEDQTIPRLSGVGSSNFALPRCGQLIVEIAFRLLRWMFSNSA